MPACLIFLTIVPLQQLLTLLGSAAYREFNSWVSDNTRISGLRPDSIKDTKKAVSQILGLPTWPPRDLSAAQVVGATCQTSLVFVVFILKLSIFFKLVLWNLNI